MTVRRPSASRLPAMNRSTSKASLLTAWSFSSSLTIARQASDERTSVGLKCLRANVLLPEPLGPIRTTRDRLGISICMIGALLGLALERAGDLGNEFSAFLTRIETTFFGQPS